MKKQYIFSTIIYLIAITVTYLCFSIAFNSLNISNFTFHGRGFMVFLFMSETFLFLVSLCDDIDHRIGKKHVDAYIETLKNEPLMDYESRPTDPRINCYAILWDDGEDEIVVDIVIKVDGKYRTRKRWYQNARRISEKQYEQLKNYRLK